MIFLTIFFFIILLILLKIIKNNELFSEIVNSETSYSYQLCDQRKELSSDEYLINKCDTCCNDYNKNGYPFAFWNNRWYETKENNDIYKLYCSCNKYNIIDNNIL